MKPLPPSSTPIDLAKVRAALAKTSGRHYWRSLEELAETKDFQEMLHREFPAQASEFTDEVSRRNFLKLMGASLALAGMTACTRQPMQKIVPYVRQPEEIVPGIPLYFATAMPFDGFGIGLLAMSYEGHPTKIEGNPGHPASLGATSIFQQASILDLYDPDRSQTVTNAGEVSSYDFFLTALIGALEQQSIKRGAGLRILTETVTSPTLASQLQNLLKKYPDAKWHQYQPTARNNVREAAEIAFGEVIETRYHFDKARVVLSLGSDFLFSHPESLRYARQFTNGRRMSNESAAMNRLYVVESTPTVTGSMADHRLPISSADVEALTRTLARQLGVTKENDEDSAVHGPHEEWIAAVTRDLQNNRGACIVVAGEQQPPAVQVLAHMINQALGNFGKTMDFAASAEAQPVNQVQSLRGLVEDMELGRVDCLIMMGGNPVFSSPADFHFADRLAKVNFRVHLSPRQDETSAYCHWHIPESHFLETWSDVRAYDGTVSIIQPLIHPLYDTWSAHDLIEAMLLQPTRPGYDIVRDHWKTQLHGPDFELSWRKALHDGIIADTELEPRQVQMKISDGIPAASRRQEGKSANLEVSFLPDPGIWDGRFANNGWLQELSKPITKLTWDNAALVSPALAERMKLNNGEVVELRFRGRTVRAPVWITPGQAENSVTLHFGYGRTRVGRVGEGTGFNAYSLRTSDAMWFGPGLEITKTGGRQVLASTQNNHNLQGRDIVRSGTFEEFRAKPNFIHKGEETPRRDDTLYNPEEFKSNDPAWGMVINLTTCIGCNACVVACQSENNIPVVGKDQVARGRDMLWIRVDQYFQGSLDNPRVSNQPVPCMHCEHAPCELVCPVEATLHDHEGLNLQVYNRCVGTRYCSNNCPYKVRRFNFFSYNDYRDESLRPMRNPNVTVRWRGVMEKCTYCIQRIAATRITAKKEARRIGGNEVMTACQQACPTEAIVFGDINDPNSSVTKQKAQPLNYSMLGELNTRPRTTYLAKLRNPNPELEPQKPQT